MKGLLVNLLIALSLLLCGFNAVQWFREAKLRGELQVRSEEIFQKGTEIQNLQQSLKLGQAEVSRLEQVRETLASMIRSNRVYIGQILTESDQFRRDAQIQAAKAAQGEQYREAFEKANENLKRQNQIIESQNSRLLGLAKDHNDLIARYNSLATNYQGLASDYAKIHGMYTNLVSQVQASNSRR